MKKYKKKPVSDREKGQVRREKSEKARKSGREKLTLHVKKCKKRSKIGFYAHFCFHAQKKNTAKYHDKNLKVLPKITSYWRKIASFVRN